MNKKHFLSRLMALVLAIVMITGSFSTLAATAEDDNISIEEETAATDKELSTSEPSEVDTTDTTDTTDSGDASSSEETSSQATASPGSDVIIPSLRSTTPGDDGSTYSLTWVGSSDDTLTVTCTENVSQTVMLQVDFSIADGTTADVGAIEIRIPASVITGRDGSAVGAYSDIPLPGDTDYDYYIDEATNEIVIYNFNAIMSSDTKFSCQIPYTFMPYQVDCSDSDDGTTYINDDITATFKVNDVVVDTETLTLEVETQVVTGSISKSTVTKYEVWQTAWGTAPSDINTDDYFYVRYEIRYLSSANCSQPYTTTLIEDVSNGGFVVHTSSTPSSGATVSGSTNDTLELTYSNPVNRGEFSYWYVDVAYPRSLYLDEGTDTCTVKNDVTAQAVGVDGAEGTVESDSASYIYTVSTYEYKGNYFSVTKSRYGADSYRYGAIDAIEAGDTVSLSQDSSSATYNLTAIARGYGLTKDSNGEYEVEPYTVDLIDDLIYLNGTQLNPGDYSITTINISNFVEYVAYENTTSGDLEGTPITDYNNYDPIEIYYKTTAGNWIHEGTLVKTSLTGSVIYTTDSGVVTTSTLANLKITLPDGACGVKLSCETTSYQVNLGAYITVTLNSTDHVKKILETVDYSTPLYNFDTLVVTDSDGSIANSAGITGGTSALNTQVYDSDTDLYGQRVQHYGVNHNLTRLSGYSSIAKTAADPTNVSDIQQVKVPYTVNIFEYGTFSSALYTLEEAVASGVVQDQTEGVFYDLLPAGATVDTNSIVAKCLYSNAACTYTAETVDNWQGSGQTMLIVSVKTVADSNYYSSKSSGTFTLRSGLTVNYDLYYSWQSYMDYGNSLLNSVAYRSSTGTLSAGTTAENSGLTKKEYYASLTDEDGLADDTDQNTLYAQRTTNLSVPVSSQTGFTKKVKAADGLVYDETATVSASEAYTYQLRYATDATVTARNIIFYDVLEADYGTNSYWKGTLEGIDTSYLKNLGINPIIYYSTVSGLNQSDTSPDLTDTTIWTTVAPSDLSTVTGIAIDASTKTDGTEFKLGALSTVLCYITLRAPADYETYQDDLAYNKSVFIASLTPITGSNEMTSTLFSSATVALDTAKATINKTSDPASGTAEDPADVEVGDTINYTISVKNTNSSESITGVEITDVIPDGLEVDLPAIKCYFGNDPSSAVLVSDSSRVTVTLDSDGQTLVFTVNKLAAGETVHLIIPATVASGGVFENTAEITEYNGLDQSINSETTYHETLVPTTTIDVTATKVWDDNSDQDGKRPDSVTLQLYADGVSMGDSYKVTVPAPATDSDTWSYTWSTLTEYSSPTDKIVYTVKEVSVPTDYTDSYSADGLTITNSYTPETVAKTVTKTWSDAGNQDGIRTDNITVQLYADGVACGAIITISAADSWNYKWDNLDKYSDGEEIVYTVKEINVPDGYADSYSTDTFAVTNTHTPETTERTVTKVWDDTDDQDGLRPDSVTLQLKADGELYDTITLSESNDWTHTWTDLPKNDDGTEITYTVVELNVDKYTATYSEDTFTITNSYIPGQVSKTVSKVWDDENNQDGIRSDSVTVQLYADGKAYGAPVELNEDNGWAYTWQGLAEKSAGTTIVYTVGEITEIDQYTTTYSDDTFIITNSHVPNDPEETVTKVWDDNDNKDGKRPDSVTVQLYANGKAYGDPVELNAANNWTHTWGSLPEYMPGGVGEPFPVR